jgi:hypothetical protein
VGARSGLSRAAFAGQPRGLGSEGGIIASAFDRRGTVFHDVQKLRPYSVQIYSTTLDIELAKLLKENYPVLRDFETKAKPGENVVAATMALLKSTFPAI